jgi:hypothetical protein
VWVEQNTPHGKTATIAFRGHDWRAVTRSSSDYLGPAVALTMVVLYEGEFVTDPAQDPTWIDLTATGGDVRAEYDPSQVTDTQKAQLEQLLSFARDLQEVQYGKTQLGLFRVEDATLTMAFGQSSGNRPIDLSSNTVTYIKRP